MIIGVTGKSGVGKSTYAKKYAQDHNMFYLDIDEIGHKILDDPEVRAKVKEKFNIDVSSNDRKKLGELVFASRNNEMKQLADITWEKMKSIINDYIEFNLVPGIVLDWILLPHTPFFKMCDKKILIKTDEAKRRNRLKQRDNISEEDINLRDNASISYNEEDFDEIINN
jgi:dephospho-CoA kinase